MATSDAYVSVPVPADRVLDVYSFLSSQDNEGGRAPSTQSTQDVAELEKTLRSASATVQGLAVYLAERAGEEVTTEEAASALALDRGWNSLAGALGAFGRYL